MLNLRPDERPGVRDQVARHANSFEEAHRQHTWKVPERYNIAFDIVDRWASDPAHADLMALGFLREDDTLDATSWRELRDLSQSLAIVLRDQFGVSRGDFVAVFLGQCLAAVVTQIAVYRLGAVVCPISHLYSGTALTWRLHHSEAKVLVTDTEGWQCYVADLAEIAPERRPTCQGLVASAGGSPGTSDTSLPSEQPRATDYWEAVHATPPVDVCEDTAADDPALLIYTSGTQRDPKGVLHAHRVALGHANVSYILDNIRDDDVFWSPNDWSWVAGVGNGLLVPLGFGIPILSMGPGRFDPVRAQRFLRAHRPTIGYLPATALRLLRSAGTHLDHRMRCLMSGGEVVDAQLRSWCIEHLAESVNVGFGQTEGNDFLGTVTAWEQPPVESIGKLLPGHYAAILSPEGNELSANEQGELCFRTDGVPVIMLRYLKNPEQTNWALRDGWLHTGDYGWRDTEGYFYYGGRNDDIIKSSGYRIGPAEIETVIARHPLVRDCIVIGLPDPARGQVVTAVMQIAPEADVAALTREVAEQVRENVGKHAYPRRFEIVEEFPRTVTGKIQRSAVKRLFLEAAPTPRLP